MEQVAVLAVLVGVGVGVAAVLRRRDQEPPEQGPSWTLPVQVDRADFDRPDAPWLVLVFSSATCLSCRGTWEKAEVLTSDAVAVQEIEVTARKDLHDKYAIEAVPIVLVSDSEGVVQRSFLGPPTATDLWAALADLREPGSVPAGCGSGDSVCSGDSEPTP